MQKFKVKSTSLTRTALTMTLLVIASIAVMNKALSAGSTPGAIANPIRYGRVNNAQLSDLAPANSRALRDLLLHRRFDEAASDLQRELSQYPGSLAGYVGLMQVEPERWPVEIKRLRGEIAKQSANRQPPKPTDLFKLGTLLYYQWGQQPAPPRDRKQLAEAQALLAHAWHSDHAPIIGLMLGEMLGVEAASSDPSVKGLNTKKISQELLYELCGPQAYAQYLRAQSSSWNAKPPTVSLIPAENVRPLVAVVASLHSFYGIRGFTAQIINGKSGPSTADAVSASQLAHQRYLDQWYKHLVDAIPTL